MAVVSISRIQVRRGTINQGTSLPQLASGELGWAIDKQELYIGNGSTSEGAPAVGNTQILTTNTNVFELPNQYTYRSDSNIQTSETVPVSRSIAERLDDRVSIKAFGGLTPAEQLQKALFELYLKNNSSTTAPILYVEPGLFEITETIYVPPFATIVGAGKNKTIFRKVGNFDMFKTISSDSVYDGTVSNFTPTSTQPTEATQARSVRFEHMTLDIASAATSGDPRYYLLHLDSCRDSTFKHVRFINAGTLPADREVAVGVGSSTENVCTRDNKFIDCDFIGTKEAVYGPVTVKNNKFVRCKFDVLQRGVILGEGVSLSEPGAENNIISDSQFDNINQEAFIAATGTGNRSQDNQYGDNVGKDNGDEPAYPIVSYGRRGNFSVDDTFERTYSLAVNIGDNGLLKYYPEVQGPLYYTNGDSQRTTISAGTPAFRLPADASRFYTVEYFFRSNLDNVNSLIRVGTLNIMVKIRDTITESFVDLVDEYEYIGIDGAVGASINFKSEIQYDDDNAPTEILAVRINVQANGNGPDFDIDGNGDGVGGELVIKITSKS